MLRVTEDVVELRHWAEERGGRPCRDPETGQLRIGFPGDRCRSVDVGWGELEATFCACREVFVYDDAPGASRCFIGTEDDARAWFSRAGPTVPYQPPA